MISKEQRTREIEEKGFTIVDDSNFKTLESPITIKCKHGHLIQTTLKAVRHISFECPKCNHDIKVDLKAVPTKKDGVYRTIAFDQATENFGLSVFDNETLVYYGLYKFSGTVDSRLVSITRFIRDVVLKEWSPDYVCFEDIQYEHNIMTFKILAQLIGIITVLCKEQDIKYEIVSPNCWRKYAGTCGKTRREEKLLSVAKVREGYNINVTDDIAEAILIGRYAVKTNYKSKHDLAFGE